MPFPVAYLWLISIPSLSPFWLSSAMPSTIISMGHSYITIRPQHNLLLSLPPSPDLSLSALISTLLTNRYPSQNTYIYKPSCRAQTRTRGVVCVAFIITTRRQTDRQPLVKGSLLSHNRLCHHVDGVSQTGPHSMSRHPRPSSHSRVTCNARHPNGTHALDPP